MTKYKVHKTCGRFLDRIAKRDNYQCQICKGYANDHRTLHKGLGHKLYMMKGSSDRHLTVDHIIPVSEGGTNDINNLQTLCSKCNCIKSNAPQLLCSRVKHRITYKEAEKNGEEFHLADYSCSACRMKADPLGYRTYKKGKVKWEGFVVDGDFENRLTIFLKKVWCMKCSKRFGNGQIPTWFMLDKLGFFS